MNDPSPVVAIRELTKVYGRLTALDRLSLSLDRGQILGLIGPNGAGKTTAIKILVGLARPSGGSATIAGCDCLRQPKRIKRLVGYMPDTSGPTTACFKYLDFFATFGIRQGAERRIDEVMEMTGSASCRTATSEPPPRHEAARRHRPHPAPRSERADSRRAMNTSIRRPESKCTDSPPPRLARP